MLDRRGKGQGLEFEAKKKFPYVTKCFFNTKIVYKLKKKFFSFIKE